MPRPGHDIVQSRALRHSLALLELDFINDKSGFLSFYDCQLIVYIDFDLYWTQGILGKYVNFKVLKSPCYFFL